MLRASGLDRPATRRTARRPRRRSERSTICEGGPQRARGARRCAPALMLPTKPRRVLGCLGCSGRG